MSKTLTEQKVLKKLGIKDFRHLTKDKVLTMATMLDKMDPEVAKKALDQFPDFAAVMKEILIEYKQSLDKGLDQNRESVMSCYATCDAIIGSCQQMLEKDDLSFEQKQEVLRYMAEIAQMKFAKDSENKQFIAAIVTVGCVAVGVAATVLLTALGGKADIDLKKLGDNN